MDVLDVNAPFKGIMYDKEYAKEYRAKNREVLNAKQKARRNENKDLTLQKARAYREKNKEIIKEKDRIRYLKNKAEGKIKIDNNRSNLYNKKRRDTFIGDPKVKGKGWTEEEKNMILFSDLTQPEISKIIGRSIASIQKKKWDLIHIHRPKEAEFKEELLMRRLERKETY
jgi:hypothetical protein